MAQLGRKVAVNTGYLGQVEPDAQYDSSVLGDFIGEQVDAVKHQLSPILNDTTNRFPEQPKANPAANNPTYNPNDPANNFIARNATATAKPTRAVDPTKAGTAATPPPEKKPVGAVDTSKMEDKGIAPGAGAFLGDKAASTFGIQPVTGAVRSAPFVDQNSFKSAAIEALKNDKSGPRQPVVDAITGKALENTIVPIEQYRERLKLLLAGKQAAPGQQVAPVTMEKATPAPQSEKFGPMWTADGKGIAPDVKAKLEELGFHGADFYKAVKAMERGGWDPRKYSGSMSAQERQGMMYDMETSDPMYWQDQRTEWNQSDENKQDALEYDRRRNEIVARHRNGLIRAGDRAGTQAEFNAVRNSQWDSERDRRELGLIERARQAGRISEQEASERIAAYQGAVTQRGQTIGSMDAEQQRRSIEDMQLNELTAAAEEAEKAGNRDEAMQKRELAAQLRAEMIRSRTARSTAKTGAKAQTDSAGAYAGASIHNTDAESNRGKEYTERDAWDSYNNFRAKMYETGNEDKIMSPELWDPRLKGANPGGSGTGRLRKYFKGKPVVSEDGGKTWHEEVQ